MDRDKLDKFLALKSDPDAMTGVAVNVPVGDTVKEKL